MIFPTEEDWSTWQISNDAHKFLVIRWEELFSDSTYDGWQVKYTNIRTLLKEMADSIDVVRKIHAYHHNIGALIEEAKHELKNEYTAKEAFPKLVDYLSKIESAYDNFVKNEKSKHLDEFIKIVNVTLGVLDNYRTFLSDEIIKILKGSY